MCSQEATDSRPFYGFAFAHEMGEAWHPFSNGSHAMTEPFDPKNDLERALVDAQDGRLAGEDFMHRLLASQVFMPVHDGLNIGGLQASERARPLSLESEDGIPVLVLFTNPERARPFLQDYPGYTGGILEQFTWVLEKMGGGYAIALNPGWDVGLELDPDTVNHLVAATAPQAQAGS